MLRYLAGTKNKRCAHSQLKNNQRVCGVTHNRQLLVEKTEEHSKAKVADVVRTVPPAPEPDAGAASTRNADASCTAGMCDTVDRNMIA